MEGNKGDRSHVKGRAQLVSTYFGGSPDVAGTSREASYFPKANLSTGAKGNLAGQWQTLLPRPIWAWGCFV